MNIFARRLPATDLATQLGIPPTNFLSGSYFVVSHIDLRARRHNDWELRRTLSAGEELISLLMKCMLLSISTADS